MHGDDPRANLMSLEIASQLTSRIMPFPSRQDCHTVQLNAPTLIGSMGREKHVKHVVSLVAG